MRPDMDVCNSRRHMLQLTLGGIPAILLGPMANALLAQGLPPAPEPSAEEDPQARSTAVALNYCRSAFHRIRRYPSKRVLVEEQEKILNNLNLNEIADEEVVKLYTGVLDEIGDVQIAEQEQKVIRKQMNGQMYRQFATSAFALTADVMTANFSGAVRTGANSWWDYRNTVTTRELQTWQIDKKRMGDVLDKSSQFLDTFWKMARKKNLPDRWLVRDHDLDRLELAMNEQDLEVRLRVMQRMERFMECYPPYHYYVARAQQQLGQFTAAVETYERMATLGRGHFRKDDMLAAGMANRAVMEEHLDDPNAPRTAKAALAYSTDVWEVNLLCARVLTRHQEYTIAEDAALRNLDVQLEHDASVTTLADIYLESKDRLKLATLLADTEVVQAIPAPLLPRCAAYLGADELPAPIGDHLSSTLIGFVDVRFGEDDIVFRARPSWRLDQARLELRFGEGQFIQPKVSFQNGYHEVRFTKVADLGNFLNRVNTPPSTELIVKYDDETSIQLTMNDSRVGRALGGEPPLLRVTELGLGPVRLSLLPQKHAARSELIPRHAALPDTGETRIDGVRPESLNRPPAVPDKFDLNDLE